MCGYSEEHSSLSFNDCLFCPHEDNICPLQKSLRIMGESHDLQPCQLLSCVVELNGVQMPCFGGAHWVGRKGLRLYSLFWAGGWRLLECAWGRVIMWPLGTPDPQQKPCVPLISRQQLEIFQTENCPFSVLCLKSCPLWGPNVTYSFSMSITIAMLHEPVQGPC